MGVPMNPLSLLLLYSTHVVAAIMGLLPPPLATTASAFMIGNIFGVAVFPGTILYCCFRIVGLSWLVTPLSVIYIIGVLGFDPQYLKPVPDAFLVKQGNNMNWLERRASQFWRRHFDYFPISVIFDGDGLKANKQYIFGVHPHGIHCWPLNVFAFHSSDFYQKMKGMKMTGVAATVMFKIPVVRELFLLMGYRDAGRRTCQKVLEQGGSLYICTGGESESLATKNGVDAVVLEGRKGFIRLALSYGTPLVPVYGIGNNELYTTLHPFPKFRRMLSKRFHIAIPLFYGRLFSPLPYCRPVKVLIGAPIEVPAPATKGEKPRDALVDEYHAKYVSALKALHAKHAPVDVVDGKEVKRKLQVIAA